MKAVIVLLVAICVLTLALPGAAFVLAPSRTQQKVAWLRVASYSSLPQDGTPQFTPVLLDRHDAWTRQPAQTIGHVYLRRIPETGQVVALHTHTRHGVIVMYDDVKRLFRCACWGTEFDLDGKVLDNAWSPDSRDDIPRIEVKVLGSEVVVRIPTGEWPQTD